MAVGLLILLIFLVGAVVMFTRTLPALLVLPIMGLGIAAGAAVLTGVISSQDLLQGVLAQGALRLHEAMVVAFFGGVLSFIMQKSGVAESLVKQGAELIGDNPLAVAVFSMGLIALLFTSIGGLGAIIMVSMVVLPMLATVGVQPVVAGGIMLIGISLGGILNAGNWIIYTKTLGVPVDDVKTFALTVFLLTAIAGVLFICIELFRAGIVRSVTQLAATMGITCVVAGGTVAGMLASKAAEPPAPPKAGWLASVTEATKALPGASSPASITVAIPPATDPVVLLNHPLPKEVVEAEFLSFSAGASSPGTLTVEFRGTARGGNTATSLPRTLGLKSADDKLRIKLAPMREALTVESVTVSFKPSNGAGATVLTLSDATGSLPPQVSPVTQGIRGVVGLGLVVLVGTILLDIRARVRRWRHQVVRVKWYGYLIPIVPLLLILVFNVPIMAAFFLGFVYAILATARPGSVSLTIQSMIQGSASVMPAVMLMIGIGILINAVMGPSDWSGASQGLTWPVRNAIEPVFKVIIPTNAFGYVLVFGLCAPLALYRGPLNVWGLGFGVATILLASGNLPGAAIMAMLLTVGQVQGICDPTNTQNVWLANELRVDVQALMWRTLPYIWGMVFVGLTIAAIMFLGGSN